MKKSCPICQKEFEKSRRMSLKIWNNKKYCSRKCYFKNFKPHSGNFKKGTPSWCNGKKGQYHHSLEARIKKSKMQKRLGRRPPILKGEKHWNWKGGISPENNKIRNSIEVRLWRESVFARDNWTCEKCKVRGGKLCSHHIKNFSETIELRTSIKNGITLCKVCHKLFHHIYGVKNNNSIQLAEFLKK